MEEQAPSDTTQWSCIAGKEGTEMRSLTISILAALALGLVLVSGCSDVLPTEPEFSGREVGEFTSLHEELGLDAPVELQHDEETQMLIPLDGTTIPTGEAELDQWFLRESAVPGGEETRLALSSYWRYACFREICYALSSTRYHQGRWGESTRVYSWHGRWFAGDWNYMGLGRGIGDTCKKFAREIVRRATGGRCQSPERLQLRAREHSLVQARGHNSALRQLRHSALSHCLPRPCEGQPRACHAG